MLPIMLSLEAVPVVLYGAPDGVLRRKELLQQAGATDIRVFDTFPPGEADIAPARLLFMVDVEDTEARRLSKLARRYGVLVNVEDRTALCDFYTPSVVRRGDLVIAISTNGQSPGLARRLREHLSAEFGPEWEDRVRALAEARQQWRDEGADMKTISRRTHDYIEKAGWL